MILSGPHKGLSGPGDPGRITPSGRTFLSPKGKIKAYCEWGNIDPFDMEMAAVTDYYPHYVYR